MKVEVREDSECGDDYGEDQNESEEIGFRGRGEASGFGLGLFGLKQIVLPREFIARGRALRRIA